MEAKLGNVEFDVVEGSHIFIRRADGTEVYFEWSDASAEVRETCKEAMKGIVGAFKAAAKASEDACRGCVRESIASV